MHEALGDQDAGAERDRRVGDVEGRPVPARGMEIEEIDDVAVGDAVVQVAQGTAQDERQAGAEQFLVSVFEN